MERRRRAFTLLHASVQWSEFLVVPLCSNFIKRPSSSQKNITMTFPADTLELLLSPSPRVCHKAPFHRLPLEFRFKMVDPGSTPMTICSRKPLPPVWHWCKRQVALAFLVSVHHFSIRGPNEGRASNSQAF